MKFTKTETAAFGLGAVGKDMVYALASSYVLCCIIIRMYWASLPHLSV